MSAVEIEQARQNLVAALRPAVGAVPAQREIMFAIEDLIRAYALNHVQSAPHSMPCNHGEPE